MEFPGKHRNTITFDWLSENDEYIDFDVWTRGYRIVLTFPKDGEPYITVIKDETTA